MSKAAVVSPSATAAFFYLEGAWINAPLGWRAFLSAFLCFTVRASSEGLCMLDLNPVLTHLDKSLDASLERLFALLRL